MKELEIKYQSNKTIDFNNQNVKSMLGVNSGQLTILGFTPNPSLGS